ncbi:hypothetical protein KC363_g231 [Hortaea werneckii]|nr:hypothetical protein KC363_g231 [Hortaea werneckii]
MNSTTSHVCNVASGANETRLLAKVLRRAACRSFFSCSLEMMDFVAGRVARRRRDILLVVHPRHVKKAARGRIPQSAESKQTARARPQSSSVRAAGRFSCRPTTFAPARLLPSLPTPSPAKSSLKRTFGGAHTTTSASRLAVAQHHDNLTTPRPSPRNT